MMTKKVQRVGFRVLHVIVCLSMPVDIKIALSTMLRCHKEISLVPVPYTTL